MSNVWVTSDHHFGHARIIELSYRPFGSVDDMDDALVDAWNSVVRDGDLVYHLGDFCWSPYQKDADRLATLTARLNGWIVLVYGNHDPKVVRAHHRWIDCADKITMRTPDGMPVVLRHHGVRSQHEADVARRVGEVEGVLLHGHAHGKSEKFWGTLDVGVDCHAGYAPILLSEAVALAVSD